eukprot:322379-Rhodomonas_salina.1
MGMSSCLPSASCARQGRSGALGNHAVRWGRGARWREVKWDRGSGSIGRERVHTASLDHRCRQ